MADEKPEASCTEAPVHRDDHQQPPLTAAAKRYNTPGHPRGKGMPARMSRPPQGAKELEIARI